MPDTYFDLPPELSRYGSARVAVLPVPFERTTSYVKGTGRAPAAILKASAQVELYDEETGKETCEVGIATLPPVRLEKGPIEKTLSRVEDAVGRIVSDGKLPVMLGGEHSITPPAVKAVAKAKPDLTVLQFDAHADLREEYDGTKWSHACAMARVLEICPAVQVGIRNLSAPEAGRVAGEKLPVFFAHNIRGNDGWIADVLASIKTKDVYITFDVDAFDSSVMPDTGTPEPGGLLWYDVTRILAAVAREKNVVAMDFVELLPQKGHHASDFMVAKLIYKAIGYWAASRNL